MTLLNAVYIPTCRKNFQATTMVSLEHMNRYSSACTLPTTYCILTFLSSLFIQYAPESFALPACELQDANQVLREAVASTRRQRARERGEDALMGASSVFSQEELMQLREAFASQDPMDSGFIRVRLPTLL